MRWIEISELDVKIQAAQRLNLIAPRFFQGTYETFGALARQHGWGTLEASSCSRRAWARWAAHNRWL